MHLFLAPPGPDEPGPEIESLNNLLRGELAALAAYTRALSEFNGHPAEAALRRLRGEHEAAAGLLCEVISNLDGEADVVADAAADSAPVVRGGSRGLLADLRACEEQGLRNCEAILQAEHIPEEARFAVRAHVLPRCHEHIDALAELVESPPPKG